MGGRAMSKQQTAVEWLEEQISNSSYYKKLIEDIESPLQVQIEGKSKTLKPKSIIQQAKQMEKEQIVDAHLLGLVLDLTKDAYTQAEQYYQQTYGEGND
jgi:hypothetical protein